MRGGPLIWLWPLATTPPVESGLEFEVNGFEDVSCTWPPPDPDRISRKPRTFDPTYAFTHEERLTSNNDQIEAFRKRQEKDFERFRRDGSPIARRKAFHTRFRDHASQLGLDRSSSEDDGSHAGEEAWRNSEGDRLGDFGVDEDAEFYDEDDVPIAQLLRRREAALYPKRRERLHRE
ncbi:Palmitoyltransferase [Lignoscripta atroalba]|nr:Palmitoyltransferase [Lignoscripta atroalba]